MTIIFVRSMAAIIATGILLGCDSTNVPAGSDTGIDRVDLEQILTQRPFDHNIQRIAAAVEGDRLINGDFIFGDGGWSTCSGSGVNYRPTVPRQAQIAAGDCVQQGVTVTEGETLALQCQATSNFGSPGQTWTGMGISFYDQNWNFISEPNAALINATNSVETYSVTGTVPPGAAFAGVWLYSDPGATVISCVLADPGTLPTPPVTALLFNNDFSIVENNTPLGWNDYCGGDVFKPFSSTTGVRISNGGCMTQSLSSSAIAQLRGKPFSFNCLLETQDSNATAYAEISTNLPGTHTAERVINVVSGPFAVYGVAGNDIDNAYVSLFVDGEYPRTAYRCDLVITDPVNERPIAVDDVYEFDGGSAPLSVDLQVTQNDYDPDGDIHHQTILITKQPDFGTLTRQRHLTNYYTDSRIADSFRYRVADGQNRLSEEATVFIRYREDAGNNLPPVTGNDMYIVDTNNRAITRPVLNDYDPDGPLASVQIINQPLYGNEATFYGVQDINNSYVSYRFLSTNTATRDSFDYRVADANGAISDATVTLWRSTDTDGTLRVPQPMTAPTIDGVIGPFEYLSAGAGHTGTTIEGESQEEMYGVHVGYDDQYLYLATRIEKPLITDSYPVTGNLWDDDSFEIYFDLGNEGAEGYDDNDFLRIFGFGDGDPVTYDGRFNGPSLSHLAKCQTTQEGSASITTCEVRFDLAEMGLIGTNQREFGFDIQWNIDRDGGTRDSKYSWCKVVTNAIPRPSLIDLWQDMSNATCSVSLGD